MPRKPKRIPCDDIPDGVHFEQVYPASGEFVVVRRKDGDIIAGAGNASTARHLYKGTTWWGVMQGLTDSGEAFILNALNTVHPKTVMPQRPCDAECPKCGAADIYRRHRRKGEEFNRDPGEYDTHEDRAIAYDTYRAMATEECIQHRCRTCQFEWNTSPMNRSTAT